MLDVITELGAVLAQIPDPGGGQAPPGSEGLTTMLRWAAYVALAICVVGAVAAGAMMAISHRRGEGGEHLTRLGWVLAGAIIIGSASGFVSAVV